MNNLSGTVQIHKERQHQIEALGFTRQKDMAYRHGELAEAAQAYLMADGSPDAACPDIWPWSEKMWNPQSRINNLVRAGALIAAEIDRLQSETGN
ncbi:MAG: hypothetical protein Q4A84_08430 [Neisseria sp.]|uniref:hypothetical protein n=1 Tax=Neisseria sp. TaxID=192066 RepID=UPI0026DD12D4|nr:hypothetical protein [Neisseria sp.]MDO4641705.1 hypothetical protein [Neisseria sp.]